MWSKRNGRTCPSLLLSVQFIQMDTTQALPSLPWMCWEDKHTVQQLSQLADNDPALVKLSIAILRYDQFPQFGLSLGLAVANNKHLTTLTIHVPDFSDTDMEHLAKGLAKNTTLTTLQIQFPSMTKTGAVHLANMLQAHQSIDSLHLHSVTLGTEGCKALAHALMHPWRRKAIKALTLSQCDVGDGFKYICKAVDKSADLTTLSLTPPSPTAFALLMKALLSNRSITALTLSSTPQFDIITVDLASALMGVLVKSANTWLTVVDLQYTSIAEDYLQQINRIVSHNAASKRAAQAMNPSLAHVREVRQPDFHHLPFVEEEEEDVMPDEESAMESDWESALPPRPKAVMAAHWLAAEEEAAAGTSKPLCIEEWEKDEEEGDLEELLAFLDSYSPSKGKRSV